MKRTLFCIGCFWVAGTLFAQLSPVAQQIYSYAPWRLIGTNLYDFSPVIQGALNGDPGCGSYFIRGRVASARAIEEMPALTLVQRAVGKPRSVYIYRGASNLEYASSGSLLQSLAAAQLAQNSGGQITIGQYMAMAPSMRANYELVQLQPPVESTLVKDLPVELRRTGMLVEFFALPIGKYNVQGLTAVGKGGIPYFLYGTQYRGSLTNHPVIFRVTPSGVQTINQRTQQ
jgi:hypothetical protein